MSNFESWVLQTSDVHKHKEKNMAAAKRYFPNGIYIFLIPLITQSENIRVCEKEESLAMEGDEMSAGWSTLRQIL